MNLSWLVASSGHNKQPSPLGLIRLKKFLLLVLVVVLGVTSLGQPARADQIPTNAHSIQPYLDRVMDQVREFRLDNGMKFIVLQRNQAPVVSFLIHADVGGADEPEGQTGVAHYLEHLAFKGTKRIGTLDYEAEKPLLKKLDSLFDSILVAQNQGKTEEVAKLRAEFEQVEKEASKYVSQNEFGRIVEQAGGVGMNATTSADETRYFYSLPSNKLELWMSLESERFLEPVFREFFKEKEVILEERQLRTDNSAIGQMVEAFAETAFQVHPYRRPVIGYLEDLQTLTRQNVRDFFDTYYVPNNLTVAVVGDVDPLRVQQLAETYFGRYQSRSNPPQLDVTEPPQQETREITKRLPSQPWYLEGYHRPAINHPDNVVIDAIASILSSGRTSRLYQSLVEQQQVALAAQGISSYPGNKHENLMLFYALTSPGHTVDDVAAALNVEIDRLKNELVSQKELERVKTQARASLLRSLDSNMGMAFALVEYQVKTGSWRNLFKTLDAIVAITPEDIQRVANAIFRPENRTVGRLLSQD